MGLVIDRIGKRPLVCIISGVLLTLAIITTSIGGGQCEREPVPCNSRYFEVTPLVVAGVVLSIYENAIYTCIPLIVKPQALGTAFGLMTAIMNVGSSIFPTIGSYIHDETLHMADGMKGFRYVGDILLF